MKQKRDWIVVLGFLIPFAVNLSFLVTGPLWKEMMGIELVPFSVLNVLIMLLSFLAIPIGFALKGGNNDTGM